MTTVKHFRAGQIRRDEYLAGRRYETLLQDLEFPRVIILEPRICSLLSLGADFLSASGGHGNSDERAQRVRFWGTWAIIHRMLHDRLAQLIFESLQEFEKVADYVWKAPKLVDYERKLELRKLDAYFPDRPELRKRRWVRESEKLDRTFPYLIAIGNLFSVLSLFESCLLRLVTELRPYTSVRLDSIRQQGLGRLFVFLRQAGIRPESVPLHEQVQAAIKIRNCVMHASGLLNGSRDHNELRRIRSEGLYLSQAHLERRRDQCGLFYEVDILPSPLGERLAISNDYCHLLCSYMRDYFAGLCEEARRRCGVVGAVPG